GLYVATWARRDRWRCSPSRPRAPSTTGRYWWPVLPTPGAGPCWRYRRVRPLSTRSNPFFPMPPSPRRRLHELHGRSAMSSFWMNLRYWLMDYRVLAALGIVAVAAVAWLGMD